MDTIIVNNHTCPIIPDSIIVKNDYSLIVNELDSLVKQNRELLNIIAPQGDKSISSEVIFTTLVTIGIFTVGVIIERLIKWSDRSKNKRQTRTFFIHHLNKIINKNGYTQKLSNAYQKIYDETSIDTILKLSPPEILSNDFQRVLNVDLGMLFGSFRNKTALSNVISQIEATNEILSRVRSYHSRSVKISDNLKLSIRDEAIEVLLLLLDLEQSLKGVTLNEEQKGNMEKILNTLSNYTISTDGIFSYTSFINDFLHPIRKAIFVEEMYQLNDNSKGIYKKCVFLHTKITELELQTSNYREQYLEFAKKIEEARNDILTNIKIING